ncbi:hypothetical protein T440DRAFT_470430 [Plenodomus tracheiphilus IPT5]|uniref:Uncharacterized protein n=1 Tax=Plenodomus tracheiphilus IPT5 TaxID=1408161 RepID=A0A6A7AXS7_9PLEO|nr:hypothetical protein T440DRAFT_470430 [Plenodomus tracheiphilus IPT5]
MQRTTLLHHPSLELGLLRIPGPTLPIALLCLPFFVRPHTRRRLLGHPAFKEHLGHLLTAVHLLLYIYNIQEILSETGAGHSNTLPLLEYLSLVLGEAALQETHFWLYTNVALGWALSVSLSLSFNNMPPSSIRALISLLLSVPSALGNNGHISNGARFSALSLLTRTTFWILNGTNVVHGFSATTAAKITFPLLGRLLYAEHVRIAPDQAWWNRLLQAFQAMFRNAQQDGTEQGRECTSAAVAMQTSLGVGWILSSFIWSCFRWRWLFLEQVSRTPSWTAFSFLGGTQFFVAWMLVKWWYARDPTGDVGVFTQRQLRHCLEATWWTSCFYLLLWLICELV